MKKLVKIVSLKSANSIAKQMYTEGYKKGSVDAATAFTKGSIIGLGIVFAGSLVAKKIKASKEPNQPEDAVDAVTDEVTDEK